MIKTSTAASHGNKKPRVTLGCERSGTAEKKLNVTGSKKCGCSFTLQGAVVGTNDRWMIEKI